MSLLYLPIVCSTFASALNVHVMETFEYQVRVAERMYEFSFMKLFTANSIKYYVTAIDCDNKSHLFLMEKRKERWKIIDVPRAEWIHSVEASLERAILLNTGE